jgi:hypothetical protein
MTMSVWKKQSVKWFKGEKRSTKGVNGAEPRTLYSKRFYGTLKTYDQKKKQVPLTEDQDTSEALLKTLQRTEDERRVNGYTKTQEQREKSICEHLEDFRTYLKAKNNTRNAAADAPSFLIADRSRPRPSVVALDNAASIAGCPAPRTPFVRRWRTSVEVPPPPHASSKGSPVF